MRASHCWLGVWVTLVCGVRMLEGDRALAQITPDSALGAEGSRVVQDVLIRGALALGDRLWW